MKIFYIFCVATAITLAEGQGGIPETPPEIFAQLQTTVSTLEGAINGLLGRVLAAVKVGLCGLLGNCLTLNLKVGNDKLTCYLYGENDTSLAENNTHVFAFDASLCGLSTIPTTCSNQSCSNAKTYFSSGQAINVTVGPSASHQTTVDDIDYIVAVCSVSEYCFRYQNSTLIDFIGL